MIFGSSSSKSSNAKASAIDISTELKLYSDYLKNGKKETESFFSLINNENVKKYFLNLNGGAASAEGFAEFMNGAADAAGSLATNAGSASIGTSLLNGALGSLVGVAANLAIDLIVTGIINLINAQENAIKKADEALANLEERRESLQNNRTAINEISGDYQRLADGVDKFGRNISLSADEYDRYNQIANQIAEMMSLKPSPLILRFPAGRISKHQQRG